VYSYDGLGQLATFDRGTLNAAKDGISGSASRSLSWDYDAVGNWDAVTTDSATQTRAADKLNRVTSVSGATTPTYDANGNLTKDENGQQYVYDAWNRVAAVKDAGNATIAEYSYDALGCRVEKVECPLYPAVRVMRLISGRLPMRMGRPLVPSPRET
jgi:YD repeat-containing protein